jgi:hypothetical protein
MKISPKLLSELVDRGDAYSVRGRWFVALDALPDLEIGEQSVKRAPTEPETEPARERKS